MTRIQRRLTLVQWIRTDHGWRPRPLSWEDLRRQRDIERRIADRIAERRALSDSPTTETLIREDEPLGVIKG